MCDAQYQTCLWQVLTIMVIKYKKLHYRRGTVWCTMSVEILSRDPVWSTVMTSWCSAHMLPSRTSPRPQCCHRPWAVAGGPCHGLLSLRLQSAMPAPTNSPFVDCECHQDACPGVHLVSPGLLQLTAVWHQRRRLQRLQSVQNAAARLMTGARRRDHITPVTPVLQQLHWLPIRQWVVFKIAELVHQSLAGVAPAYFADDCRLLSDVSRRPLRSNSNDMRKLLVPRTHNKLGDRIFSPACPRVWKDFAPGLRRPGLSFNLFRRSLKTHLFGDWSA